MALSVKFWELAWFGVRACGGRRARLGGVASPAGISGPDARVTEGAS